jgi:aconitate hydratase
MEYAMPQPVFNALSTLTTSAGDITIYRLHSLEEENLTTISGLPYSIRVLLESVLRRMNGDTVTEDHLRSLCAWKPKAETRSDIPFYPARVIMQDFTGVPAIVDLAAMRSALARLGGNPKWINPQVPVDLVIDHSVQVDFFASSDALRRNAEIEFLRNHERYEFLRWGTEAFDHFRVVPPATGIVHQINLEYLAGVVLTKKYAGVIEAFPDTLVGTDSHTTMINALGVLGWGVGGIEAEAAIVGQPLVIVSPEVVGFRLTGEMHEGVTATDLVLTITEMLRKHGVVGKFVEFFGPGLSSITLPDRATIANMAPEYGATTGFFPVDEETLCYLQLTGRDAATIDLIERYCKEQALFRTDEMPDPQFSDILELDLGSVETSLAGPKRPQDRVPLKKMKTAFQSTLISPAREGGFEKEPAALDQKAVIRSNGHEVEIGHGAVVIAAITSCTNTSNPSVMVGAGLLAKNAIAKGLRIKPYIKTSLAPGSRVVTEYLREGGLLEPLVELGFNIVGYGCTTCIGNSGPLPAEVIKAINQADLIVSAVLSGNRNFEGRINPHVRANYLVSPPLVVAYALAGTMHIDLINEPLGFGPGGDPVYLREIWPTTEEIHSVIGHSLSPEMFRNRYRDIFTGNDAWNAIPFTRSDLYPWNPASTYIQEPPFFKDLVLDAQPIQEITGARVLVMLGNSVTTDHISPAGAIPIDGPAGQYLIGQGIRPRNFNSFGSRRGNDQVMTRGTFGNIRLKNLLIPGMEGGVTIHLPDEERMSIYDAAMQYRQEGVPLLVIAGKEYGSGSSRDWAAKGTLLLGVKAVIAESYERIHRSNLIGMGVLPLQFGSGENLASLGLDGKEVFHIHDLTEDISPGEVLRVKAEKADDTLTDFEVHARIDTPKEIEYYRNGGILHSIIRRMLRTNTE